MRQGDIVLVPFPFSNLSSIKTRPALVISRNPVGQGIICLGITSQKHPHCESIFNNDLSSGKLPLLSYVRHENVASLDKSIVRKVVASLKKSALQKILTKFKAQF